MQLLLEDPWIDEDTACRSLLSVMGSPSAAGSENVSREDVLAVWQSGPGEPGGVASNALEVYVHRLRRKLAGSPLNIRNIRGLGYMLETGTA